MTNTREAERSMDPDGSLFLPKSERELKNHQLALLLGRGPAVGKTPDELFAEHRAAKEALEELQQKVLPTMATVALTPEI